jgi:hypothetical protein
MTVTFTTPVPSSPSPQFTDSAVVTVTLPGPVPEDTAPPDFAVSLTVLDVGTDGNPNLGFKTDTELIPSATAVINSVSAAYTFRGLSGLGLTAGGTYCLLVAAKQPKVGASILNCGSAALSASYLAPT